MVSSPSWPSLVGPALLFLLAACGRVPLDLPPSISTDASIGNSGAAGAPGTGTAGATGTGTAGVTGGKCPGTACRANQICCILDGSCVDPSTVARTCPRPTTAPPQSPPGARPCGSNADCAANEFCASNTTCIGPGTCMDRGNCGTSTGTKVCGCDGVTYADVQTACRAGTATLGRTNACGVTTPPQTRPGGDPLATTYCGRDAQCQNGQRCCGIYGICFDPSSPELCTVAPPGTRSPCTKDLQCRVGVEFCDGPGCTGPGGCVAISPAMCTGLLAPVCACDAKMYTNAGCARAAGVRVGTTSCTLQ